MELIPDSDIIFKIENYKFQVSDFELLSFNTGIVVAGFGKGTKEFTKDAEANVSTLLWWTARTKESAAFDSMGPQGISTRHSIST